MTPTARDPLEDDWCRNERCQIEELHPQHEEDFRRQRKPRPPYTPKPGRYGPRARKTMSRAERESLFLKDTPRGHQCPTCNGRGWTSSPFDACYLCLGHGRVNALTLRSVRMQEGR